MAVERRHFSFAGSARTENRSARWGPKGADSYESAPPQRDFGRPFAKRFAEVGRWISRFIHWVPTCQLSWRENGTQHTMALNLNQEGADPVCREPYNFRNHEIHDDASWFSQTNRQAAGLSFARGAITGVLLGAGLWGVILVLAGLIKL